VTIVVTGSADQNPDASGAGAPVAVRIFQLTAVGTFERADVYALIDHEQQTLGTDDVSSEEFILSPSESRTLTVEPKAGVSAIGVTALFREIDQAQWRADAPVASSGPTKLVASIGKLTVTLKAAQ
jgi:type VI secretion system protein VasD